MVELKWQDPPKRTGPTATLVTDELVEALKTRPGRWALVAERIGSNGQSWRQSAARFNNVKVRTTTVAFSENNKSRFVDVYLKYDA